MARLLIPLILTVFLATGCGGGDTTNINVSVPADSSTSSQSFQPELYADFNQQEDTQEINCNDPLFTHVEPLPPGSITSFRALDPVLGVLQEATGNPYIECADSLERYYTNGVFIGVITDYEYARDVYEFWSICEIGTEPPYYGGRFGLLPHSGGVAICARLDLMPGIVQCRNIEHFIDSRGQDAYYASTSVVLFQGVPIDVDYEEEICYLRHD